MKILHTANEAHPVYKLGGLGDVLGSLPKELKKLGNDVRIVIPYHQEIEIQTTTINVFTISYNHRKYQVEVYQSYLPSSNIPLYLFYNQEYLSTSTDASDNHADKYAFFSLAISHWLSESKTHWKPDIVHLHDWHTALIPAILKHKYQKSSQYTSLLTIHNLAYQASTTTPVHAHLGFKPNQCQTLTWDYQDGNINILMEGILHADAVNTVSPTYAKEVYTPEYSFGLDQVLNQKKIKISGILNGLDYQDFNPQYDPYVYQKYSLENAQKGKKYNKTQLLNELGMTDSDDQLLIGFVGRVDPDQKGIPLIIKAITQDILPPKPHQFVFLGTGDSAVETQLRQAVQNHSNIRLITRFDEALARKIYAASDIIIIPSTFEPCGLVQMIAMSYGAIPVAHQTGGLSDTITHGLNGFLYHPQTQTNFSNTLTLAINNLIENKHKLIDQAMSTTFPWSKSATQYQLLYQNLINTNSYAIPQQKFVSKTTDVENN